MGIQTANLKPHQHWLGRSNVLPADAGEARIACAKDGQGLVQRPMLQINVTVRRKTLEKPLRAL